MDFPTNRVPLLFPRERLDDLDETTMELCNDVELYKAYQPYIQNRQYAGFRRIIHSTLRQTRKMQHGESLDETTFIEFGLITYAIWRYFDGESLEGKSPYVGTDPNMWVQYIHTVYRLLETQGPDAVWPTKTTAATLKPTKEEIIMTTNTQSPFLTTNSTSPMFETRHYIFGVDTKTMSKVDLINAIQKIEAEISALKAVKTKTTYLPARIKECEAMLAEVVKVLDATA